MSFKSASAPAQALKRAATAHTSRNLNSTAAVRAGPRPIDDSTSALDYKMHRPSRRLPHLQHVPRPPSAEEAVTNILYNTPAPSTEPYKRHLLNCLVQNEPGVLSRVSGILAGRGFNIDSLVVCQTEIRDLSRMCIVLKGQDGVIEQARRQLEDLVPVWAVLDYTKTPTIERELLLAKVSILGPEYAHHHESSSSPIPNDSSPLTNEITSQDHHSPPPFLHGNSNTPSPAVEDEKIQREQALARSFEDSGSSSSLYPGRNASGPAGGMTASEALIAKNLHMGAIKVLVEQFGGKVVDVAENSVIVEVTAKGSRVDAFLSLMRPFGVLEAARSGVMVLPRTPIPKYGGEEEVMAETGPVDLSLLPPG